MLINPPGVTRNIKQRRHPHCVRLLHGHPREVEITRETRCVCAHEFQFRCCMFSLSPLSRIFIPIPSSPFPLSPPPFSFAHWHVPSVHTYCHSSSSSNNNSYSSSSNNNAKAATITLQQHGTALLFLLRKAENAREFATFPSSPSFPNPRHAQKFHTHPCMHYCVYEQCRNDDDDGKTPAKRERAQICTDVRKGRERVRHFWSLSLPLPPIQT